MRLGLQAAALVCVVASAASWVAGYPPDIALARGMIAAMAVAVAAYVLELVVATTPGTSRAQRAAQPETSVSAAPRPLEGEVTAPDQHGEAV
jgi:hypothetical protein